MNIAPGPPGVSEMDFPLIAAVDLPLTAAGTHVMRVALDGTEHGEVKLHVRAEVGPVAGGMVS